MKQHCDDLPVAGLVSFAAWLQAAQTAFSAAVAIYLEPRDSRDELRCNLYGARRRHRRLGVGESGR